jgi:hypothetical protein
LPEADRPIVGARFVAFDYFQAMGTPLLEGRFFRDSELNDDGYGQIVILNQAAAKVLFPGRSAIGGRFTVGSNPDKVLEVIGVVRDTRDVRLEETPQPRFYWQYAFGGAQLVVRSPMPAKVRSCQRSCRVARATDSRIVGAEIRPMSEIVSATVAERRFLMTLLRPTRRWRWESRWSASSGSCRTRWRNGPTNSASDSRWDPVPPV